MRLAVSGLCLAVLTACGDGVLGFGKKSGDGLADASAAVSSGDAESTCIAETSATENIPPGQRDKPAKEKKEKPPQANNGRKKADAENEDESESGEGRDNAPAAPCPSDSETVLPSNVPSVSFARDVVPIMTVSCVSCHSARRADGGVALDTLNGVRAAIDAVLASIESRRMPLGNVTSVSQAQVDILKQWKASGFGD